MNACMNEWVAAVVTSVIGVCSNGWQRQFGNEYCADTKEITTFSEAQTKCHNRGGSELASITSDAECDYVASLMSV